MFTLQGRRAALQAPRRTPRCSLPLRQLCLLQVQDISDLGTPEEAGQQLLKQFLNEFMSTRLGVRREPKLLRTNVRTTMDGDEYYEIEVRTVLLATGPPEPPPPCLPSTYDAAPPGVVVAHLPARALS